MTGLRLAVLCLAVLAAPVVVAGNVYRCDGADGITSYANKRIPGARCKLVGSYKAERVPKPKPTPAASASPMPDRPEQNRTAVATPAATSAPPPAVAPGAGPRLIRGQVYAYTGKDGVRHYTSARPTGVSGASIRTIRYSYMETCYACGAKPGVDFRTLRLNTTAYQDEIRAAAREHGVEEAVVRAIIHAESAFNPKALSRVGAQGLMQLMPATARRFGVGMPSTPPRTSAAGCVTWPGC